MEKVEPGMWVMKDRDSGYNYDSYETNVPEIVQVARVDGGGGFSIVGQLKYTGTDTTMMSPKYWKPAKQHYIKQFKQIYESTTKTDATGRIDS